MITKTLHTILGWLGHNELTLALPGITMKKKKKRYKIWSTYAQCEKKNNEYLSCSIMSFTIYIHY